MTILKVVEFNLLKDTKKTKTKSQIPNKTHADLLKEAFVALEKYNVPQIYKS